MEAAAPSAALRVYGPSNFEDDELVFNSEETGRLQSELLAKIEGCYGRVRQLRGVFDAGFCFGLLDPVSNIAAGVSIARAAVDAKEEEEEEERSLPGARLGEPDLIGDMNRRSFHGLVAFLTALFPHLTNAMAIWYLNEARLDPLVAAHLVIKRRGMERSFGFASDTTVAAVETALRCAAAAAQHPNPSHFALGWKLLSHSDLNNNVAPVLPSSADSDYSDESFATAIAMVDDVLLKKQPQPTSVFSLEKPWELAAARLLSLSPDLSPIVLEKKVFLERAAVWRMLLTTIHGYYLQALARLPKGKLQSHYHHSLLQAGHCYGPLDPVSNIILNTIWYSRAYPPAKNVAISAISTRGLLRIAVRSLYGLASFLCTRCAATHLTPDEAIRRLQAVGADLRLADPNLLLDDEKNDDAMVVSATVEQAYTAAAAAARHPEPHDQVELLRPSNSVSRTASDRLKGDAMLSHEDAEHLSESLMHSCMLSERQQQQPETKIMVLDWWANIRVEHRINKLWEQHARLVGMAKSAVDSYSNELGVPSYKLHVICGANEHVDGPVHTRPGKCYYGCSHINFLAAQSAATPPTLFFAECSNDGTKVRLCSPVRVLPPGTEQVRCMYCEYDGSRIVHPSRESFHGRDIELEKMLCGEEVYSQSYTNNEIIAHSREVSGCVGYVDGDCIYDVYRLDDTPIKAEDFVRRSMMM